MDTLTNLIAAGLFVAAALILFGLAKSLRDRRGRGETLLHAGGNPHRRRHVLAAVIFVGFGFGGLAESTRVLAPLSLALCITGFGGALAAACNANGRLLICRRGIWLFTDLIPWTRLDGYRWDEDGALVLRVTRPNREPIEPPPRPLAPNVDREHLNAALQSQGTPLAR